MTDHLAHLTPQQAFAVFLAWFLFVAIPVALLLGGTFARREKYLADDIARHQRECGERAA